MKKKEEKGEEKKEKKEERLKLIEKAKKRRETFLRMKMKAAERFTLLARKKFGNMIKGVAVIGSLARGDFVPGSDIDILVVIDDTQRDIPEELKEKLLAMLVDMGKKIDKKIQIQLHTLTELFQFAKEGDNIIYNFLRHMKPVYDGGILKPLERLLKSGEIKPTKEAMARSLDGAEFYLKKIDQYVEWILERYYRAITWATNALVMSLGENPVSVPEMPIVLQKYADQGLIDPELPAIAAEVIKIYKAVEHGDRKPKLEDAYQLEPRVRKFIEAIKKEVVGSLVSESLKGAVRSKIKTMPKIIFEFPQSRAFVWLLDDGIYMAHYRGDKLSKVFRAQVKDGKVSEFKPVKSEELFRAMEVSELRPLINRKLIKMIYEAIPPQIKGKLKRIAVEYPGRAMLDLTGMIAL